MQYQPTHLRARARTLLPAALLLLASTNCASPRAPRQQQDSQASPTAQQATAQPSTPPAQSPAQSKPVTDRTPSETVRQFYAALRERRVRDAFAISIYKPAIDSLTAEEFEELRPEFEKLGEAVPAEIGIYGEQISGDRATVFAVISTDADAKQTPIELIRSGGVWIIDDPKIHDALQREGKELLFKQRIEVHHDELRRVILKIANAEAVFAAQNGGRYADLASLTSTESSMRLGLRDDVDAMRTLGYRLTLAVTPDGRTYRVNAEPLHYGRSGRLSFYADAAGMQEKDTGGKPFNPPAAKKKG
jgi:hypothetical protein